MTATFLAMQKDVKKAIPWRDAMHHLNVETVQVTTVNGGKEMIVKLQKRDNTVVNSWTMKIIKTLKDASAS